jgi:hypothetical protein
MKDTISRINEIKSLFIEKTAIEKPLAILIKRRREKIQIDKII